MFSKFLTSIPAHTSSIVDICALSGLALWQGISTTVAFISSEDWDKITGPHGLVFVLICGLIVIWTKSVRDDVAKERRHKEMLEEQQKHFTRLTEAQTKTHSDLMELTVASNRTQDRATAAIIAMDKSIIRLSNELDDLAQATAVRRRTPKKSIQPAKETPQG